MNNDATKSQVVPLGHYVDTVRMIRPFTPPSVVTEADHRNRKGGRARGGLCEQADQIERVVSCHPARPAHEA